MPKQYSATSRFLTFEEATTFDQVFSARLRLLEEQGESESQEAKLILQLLKDFVYFTSEDTLEDLKSFLLASVWQCRLSQNKHYHVFWMQDEDFDPKALHLLLPSSLDISDAEDLVFRAMYFLAFLEGGRK
jgi:hypothetical protein